MMKILFALGYEDKENIINKIHSKKLSLNEVCHYYDYTLINKFSNFNGIIYFINKIKYLKNIKRLFYVIAFFGF